MEIRRLDKRSKDIEISENEWQKILALNWHSWRPLIDTFWLSGNNPLSADEIAFILEKDVFCGSHQAYINRIFKNARLRYRLRKLEGKPTTQWRTQQRNFDSIYKILTIIKCR